ncbi:TRAP transporter small permease [Sulfurospirillum sp. 1612]|uniref:TRAP transporter small permease n=1 Tax=Sulfurospirillum sp. 1612 TaxID=3094835 RepID=UPI002F922A7E
MIKTIDAITEFFGRLSAWIYFFIGLIVTYEVVMRYVFTSPTIWVDDISTIAQIWATYIGVAFALKHKDMIVIDVAFKNHDSVMRKILETFSLVVIIVFSGIVIYYGYQIWLDSTLKGHTTGSYLSIPKWFTQASIWVGFALLLIQALAEIVKVWTIGIAPDEESEMIKESV